MSTALPLPQAAQNPVLRNHPFGTAPCHWPLTCLRLPCARLSVGFRIADRNSQQGGTAEAEISNDTENFLIRVATKRKEAADNGFCLWSATPRLSVARSESLSIPARWRIIKASTVSSAR